MIFFLFHNIKLTFRKCSQKNNNFPAVGFGEFLKNLLLSSQLKFWKIELKVFMKVKMSKIVGHFKNFSSHIICSYQKKNNNGKKIVIIVRTSAESQIKVG